MKRFKMRSAIAMIELIFAIVIIAISVLSIPSMMAIANNSSKGVMVDEDILKRMLGEITKVSQARWDENSTAPDFRPLSVSSGGLDCDHNVSGIYYRRNPNSNMICSTNVPMMATSPATGDLNLSKGIEQLHNKSYNMEINATNGNVYIIPINYRVSYVSDTMNSFSTDGNATATWQLGSSSNPSPTTGVANATNFKRIVVRCMDTKSDTNITMTFFKSNVGKFAE